MFTKLVLKQRILKDSKGILSCVFPFVRDRRVKKCLKVKTREIIMWVGELNENVSELACEFGDIEIMEFLKEVRCPFDYKSYCGAARAGDFVKMKWLHARNCEHSSHKISLEVATQGDVEIMEWCKEMTFPLSVYLADNAAKNGNFDILKWAEENEELIKNGEEHINIFSENVFANACEFGDLRIMKWLKRNGCSYGRSSFYGAALNGNLENMIWLHENRFPLCCDTFAAAAEFGDLVNMKFLKRIGCPWDYTTISNAFKHLDFFLLDWLLENDCPHDNNWVIQSAAITGNIKLFEWMKANNFNISSCAYTCASRYVHFDLIKWLVRNNYPKPNTATVMYNFVNRGKPYMLDWLKDNGFNFGSDQYIKGEEIYTNAVAGGKMENILWLEKNGFAIDFGKAFFVASQNFSVEIMNHLLENENLWKGEPKPSLTKETVYELYKRGEFKILEKLYEIGKKLK